MGMYCYHASSQEDSYMRIFLKLLGLCLLLPHVGAFAQEIDRVSLTGVVTNKETGEPIYGCAIAVVELNLWTVSNEKGDYTIDHIPVGKEYTIKASVLGMEPFEKKFSSPHSSACNLDIPLIATSYCVEEITVLAEEKTGAGSSSIINRTAIEHLQPSSLKDVMQLLPGQVSANPDLSSPAHISIRYIEPDKYSPLDTDENGSLGTAIIVDGAPLSNNGDLTHRSPVDMPGIDVRQVAADHIVSVEVIRGIASASHGDLTSGAVIVNTKSGASPLHVKGTLNPHIKRGYVSKGFDIGKGLGAINIDAEYTSSIDNKITPYTGFDRLGLVLGYSNSFMRSTTPLSLHVKGTYNETIDFKRTDPDLIVSEEKYESSEKGLRLNLYGKWGLKKTLLSNLHYSFSLNTRKQDVYNKKIIALGYIQPISTARKDTLMEGVYAPSEYYSDMWVKGKPLDLFAKISADAVFTGNKLHNKLLYGADYRSNGNKGEGVRYDELRPPRLSRSKGARPRPYKDIPFLTQFSLFLENTLTLPLGADVLRMQAGLRYNNFQPNSVFDSELKTSIEPRVNVKYTFFMPDDSKVFDDISVFGGYGIQSKSPTLAYLYPDKAYFDLNSFNYFSNNADERLLLVSTRVVDPTNNLEPIEVKKFEAGVEGTLKGIKFMLTGYHEQSDNGLTFATHHSFEQYDKWHSDDSNIIYEAGMPPVLDLNRPSEVDTFIASYSKPQNSEVLIKKGVEFRFDLHKIRSLQTAFNINGAYRYVKSYSGSETYELPYGNGANQLPYVGVYQAGNGDERHRFNTNVIAITHLPKLRLVFSTTLQVIWKDSYRLFLGGGQPWEYTADNTTYLVEAPHALIDKKGHRTDVSKEDILTPDFDHYLSKRREEYFSSEEKPIHYQINLKVTSEIGDKAKFAFFANNLTMNNPTYTSKRTNRVNRLNSPVYFGLELSFLL